MRVQRLDRGRWFATGVYRSDVFVPFGQIPGPVPIPDDRQHDLDVLYKEVS